MNRIEMGFSIFSVIFIIVMAVLLYSIPSLRSLTVFLPLAFVGVIINVGLLFIVFKDIFSRSFQPEGRKYFWVLAILLFLPAVLIYLPMHGFKKPAA